MNLELKSYLGIPLLPPLPSTPPRYKAKGHKIKMFVHLQMEQLGKGRKKKKKKEKRRDGAEASAEHGRVANILGWRRAQMGDAEY